MSTTSAKTCSCGCGGQAVKSGWCNAAYLRLYRRGTIKPFRQALVLAPADPLFLAWCAGLFEGEGSVGIRPPSARNLGALIVTVPNTQQDIVDPFHTRWGGSLYAVDSDNRNHNRIFRWNLRASRALTFLREIHPYLRSEKYRTKVDLGIEYQEQKTAEQRVLRTPEYAARQLRYFVRMAELNKRGRDRSAD